MKSIYEKAMKHSEVGELIEAEDAFKTYLKSNPNDAMAHNKLGVVFARMSKREEAKRCFTEALKNDAYLVQAQNNLGNIAQEEGDLERAIDYYQKAILIDPNFPLPHNNLGVVYKQLNRYGDFVREIKTAKRLENRKASNSKEKLTIKDYLTKFWPKFGNKGKKNG